MAGGTQANFVSHQHQHRSRLMIHFAFRPSIVTEVRTSVGALGVGRQELLLCELLAYSAREKSHACVSSQLQACRPASSRPMPLGNSQLLLQHYSGALLFTSSRLPESLANMHDIATTNATSHIAASTETRVCIRYIAHCPGSCGGSCTFLGFWKDARRVVENPFLSQSERRIRARCDLEYALRAKLLLGLGISRHPSAFRVFMPSDSAARAPRHSAP